MEENMVENVEQEVVAEEKAPKKKLSANEISQKVMMKAVELWNKAKKLPKKTWIAIAAIALAAIVLITGVIHVFFPNTYKTPVSELIKGCNTKKTSNAVSLKINRTLNGFAESEVEKIVSIMKNSDFFADYIEDQNDAFDSDVDSKKEQYGDNYKYSYKIEAKYDMVDYQLDSVKMQFNSLAQKIFEIIKEADDYEAEDWESMAEDLDISKSAAKKLIKAFKALYKELKDVDVDDGYELDVTIKIKGSELDEPEEISKMIYVVEVNGRWIDFQSAYSLINTLINKIA